MQLFLEFKFMLLSQTQSLGKWMHSSAKRFVFVVFFINDGALKPRISSFFSSSNIYGPSVMYGLSTWFIVQGYLRQKRILREMRLLRSQFLIFWTDYVTRNNM